MFCYKWIHQLNGKFRILMDSKQVRVGVGGQGGGAAGGGGGWRVGV